MSNVEDWERKNALPSVASYLLVGASLALGLFILALAISQLWSTHSSKSWAQTQGVISQSIWAPPRSRHEDGFAQITYNYSLGGQRYEGSNLLPGKNEYSNPEQREKLRQYPVGAIVTVFYDPSHPQDSCLEPGVATSLPFLLLGVATFFILGGGWFTWRMRKGRAIPFTMYRDEAPPIIEDYKLFPKDK